MKRRRQSGFSIIELMVAIVLSIVVTDAALSLFLANRRTGLSTSAVAAVSDSGRFALDFIEQSIRSGGYMSCNAINNLHTIPLPTYSDTRQLSVLPGAPPPLFTVLNNYQQAFTGFEAASSEQGSALNLQAAPVVASASTANWINPGGLDALLTTAPAPGVIDGSDVLVVREVLPQTPQLYTAASYFPGTLVLTMMNTAGLASVAVNQVAVISNCVNSVAFQVAAVGANTITTNADLKVEFDPPSMVSMADTAAYFIGPGRDQDSALWVFHDSTGQFQELVPDVENMQVLYGIAPATPNAVTQYVTADQVPVNALDFNQVVSIRVALLAASPPGSAAVPVPAVAPVFQVLGTAVTAPIDNRLRKVFDVTITARNAAQ